MNEENYQYALLELRNTVQSDNSSRAQKFFFRELRCRLPSVLDRNFVQNDQQLQVNLQKKEQQKQQFNKSAKPLEPLKEGDSVRVHPIKKQDLCVPATCIGTMGPRSYLVQLQDGTVIRRNRRHLTLVRPTVAGDEQEQTMRKDSEDVDQNQDQSMESVGGEDSNDISPMQMDVSAQGSTDVEVEMQEHAQMECSPQSSNAESRPRPMFTMPKTRLIPVRKRTLQTPMQTPRRSKSLKARQMSKEHQ